MVDPATFFKSGKVPKEYRRMVKLGWQIQAVLYPWLSEKAGATFRYIFLGKTEPEPGDAREAPDAAKFLNELALFVEKGHFIPTSNQVMEELGLERISACTYCACVSACRRFEPGTAARHAKLFEQLAPDRCNSLLAAVKEGGGARGAKAKPGPAPARSKPRKKA